MNNLTSKVLLLLLVINLTACGMTASRNSDGYADLDALSWWDVDSTMTLSFGPRLLHFAAMFVDDDPMTKALLNSLEGVQVKIYEIEGDATQVAADLNRKSTELQEQGWEPAILVRKENETTHMLMKMSGDSIAGLTVLTSDSVEVVLVNVIGDIRPEMFHETMTVLDVPLPTENPEPDTYAKTNW